MDGSIEIDQLALTKFDIGQPVPRNEDPMLVRGQGRYTDDINLPGQTYAGADMHTASSMRSTPKKRARCRVC
jgi:CO/xanthine dehydrogenase Mo-binding subunit